VASRASSASPLIGVLLLCMVMAGMLGFEPRLCIAAAAVAIVALAVQLVRATRRHH
jgi:hypothetical protein